MSYLNSKQTDKNVTILWRLGNRLIYKLSNGTLKEVSEDKVEVTFKNNPLLPDLLYFLSLSQSSRQQKANSQSSGSQKTSKGGRRSQIQAERGQKGLQGKQEKGDQRSLSSRRRKTSESAGSGEKRRQSKTYTRRQPDTVGQRE